MDRAFLKLIINNLRLNNGRNYVRGARLTPNPGIERQLKIFSEKKTENLNFQEENEDSEADFMNVSQQHKHWQKEAIRHKERVSNVIVKNKYFKEKLPNFLTWSEKEQIRLLYNEDPDEWNYEKLSESFPADVETITKVVKSKWSPNDEKRIEKHDSIVKQNWELLKQNNIENVNPRLAAHLHRFINRENFQGINLQSIKLGKQKDLLKLHEPKSNEFASIITRFSASKSKELPEKMPNTELLRLEASENLSIGGNKPTTLARLKNLNNDMKSEIVTNIENDKKVNIHLEQHIDLMKTDDNGNNKLMQAEVERVDIIKESIKIPKKLWKEGATYKIKDCFYDCDGEFLYRVPGMSG